MTDTKRELLHTLHRLRKRQAWLEKIKTNNWVMKDECEKALRVAAAKLQDTEDQIETLCAELPSIEATLTTLGMDATEIHQSLSAIAQIERDETRK